MALTAEVGDAIEEIRRHFDETVTTVIEDGQGGAWILVEDVDLGEKYSPARSWIGFQITFQYPYSDVYPHFVRGDLSRSDGDALGEGTSAGQFQGRPAIQVSRRSNHLNPATDTALLKLLKVLDWIRSRP